MKKWMMLVAGAVVLAMSAAAPAQDAAKPHRIGVIDLDALAKAVGRDVSMRQQLEAASTQMEQQLQAATEQMRQQIEAEQKKLGENPSDEDRRRVQVMIAQANQNVANNQAAARAKFQQLRNEAAVQFRMEVRPVVQEAARKAGVTVVMVSDGSLLWYEPSVDITDEAIAAYRANPPVPLPPAQPADAQKKE